MNQAAKLIAAWQWKFAPRDQRALAELTARLERAGSRGEVIGYTALVADVRFQIDTVNDGKPFEVDAYSWTELNRLIIGDFLGCISARSYLAHGFLLSVLAGSSEDLQPTAPFFNWAGELGLLTDNTELGRIVFSDTQRKLAYAHYQRSGGS